MRKSLSKMNTNELRDLAVELGADRKKLYGTSKQSLILTIDRLRKEAASKENYIIVDENDNVMFGGQHYTEVGADRVWNMYNGIYEDENGERCLLMSISWDPEPKNTRRTSTKYMIWRKK